jgi:hypothetical protein
MALYRNDLPQGKLTKEQVQEVYDFMGWGQGKGKERPAVIKFPDSMYFFNKDNNRNTRPPRVNIPLEMTEFVDGEGSVKWNYTEGIPREVDKQLVYPRTSKPMTGTFSVGVDKIDFLWFLIKSRFRANMPDETNRVTAAKPLFKIEMKEKEARQKLDSERLKHRINAYINGPEDMVWPIEKVLKYAIAFGIRDAEEMGPNELRATLLGRIQGQPNGYNEFEKLANSDADADATYVVKKAINDKKIGFNKKTRKWVYLTEDGKDGTEICGTRTRLSDIDSLVEFLKEDSVMLNAISSLVEDSE